MQSQPRGSNHTHFPEQQLLGHGTLGRGDSPGIHVQNQQSRAQLPRAGHPLPLSLSPPLPQDSAHRCLVLRGHRWGEELASSPTAPSGCVGGSEPGTRIPGFLGSLCDLVTPSSVSVSFWLLRPQPENPVSLFVYKAFGHASCLSLPGHAAALASPKVGSTRGRQAPRQQPRTRSCSAPTRPLGSSGRPGGGYGGAQAGRAAGRLRGTPPPLPGPPRGDRGRRARELRGCPVATETTTPRRQNQRRRAPGSRPDRARGRRARRKSPGRSPP